MLIPAFYTYGRGSEDVRFVFMILPLTILVSLYAVNKWKIKRKNLMSILMITAIIFASFIFLDSKKIDYDYEKEVFSITKFITSKTSVINGDSVDGAGESLAVHNTPTGSKIYEDAEATAEHVEVAVRDAR